jgi:AmmeMemoRadiSam system protein A
MDRLLFDDYPVTLDEAEFLLDLSEVAIRAWFEGTAYPGPDLAKVPEALRRPCGAFVTLKVDGRLNGCIGNIDSPKPIGTCVVDLTRQAAFDDPRLPRLRRSDLGHLEIEVSLLSPRTPVPAATRTELLEQLVPPHHGLILNSGERRAVFLPTVWAELPNPDHFVDRLLHKAGLPMTGWPSDMQAQVFTTASVSREVH